MSQKGAGLLTHSDGLLFRSVVGTVAEGRLHQTTNCARRHRRQLQMQTPPFLPSTGDLRFMMVDCFICLNVLLPCYNNSKHCSLTAR